MPAYKYANELAAYTVARQAAVLAAAKLIEENPGQWYPCGFSWVKIRPAKGRFVAMMKDQDIGRTGMEGGYDIYNPSGNATQWMDAKLAGSKAFVDAIKKFYPTMDITVQSRID
jgi:hypothetical protein